MLFSIGMATVCLAGFAWSESLALLFVFRTLHGAAAANISTAQACIADSTTAENRAKGMGLIGAAFGLGFTVGPFIGGELSVHGLAAPIWFAAALSAINFVVAVAWLKETRKPNTERPVRSAQGANFALSVPEQRLRELFMLSLVVLGGRSFVGALRNSANLARRWAAKG